MRIALIVDDVDEISLAMQIKSQIDEEFLDLGVILHQLLLHQDLFLVFYLVVLRDGGVAVELQLIVAVLRLAWLVVGVLVGVVVGQGHLIINAIDVKNVKMFITSKVTSSEVFFLHIPLSNHG